METTETIQKVNELVSVLTDDQKQLLKDTINMGFWGDTDMEFRKENDEVETVSAYGYCTNDAKKAGHFKGRKFQRISVPSIRNFVQMRVQENFSLKYRIGGMMVRAICYSSARSMPKCLRNGQNRSNNHRSLIILGGRP